MYFKLSGISAILISGFTIFPFTEACTPKSDKENSKEIQSYVNNTFQTDSLIKEQADLLMDGQEEVKTFDDLILNDTTNKRKKSSTVKIIVLQDDMNDAGVIDELRCLASSKNDTLLINIGTNNGFSGAGVSIKYTRQVIETNIYEFTDVVDPSQKEPIYTIESQKLILNKSKFSAGDSLYGHVYARMIKNKTVKYYASGYFRAKISLRE